MYQVQSYDSMFFRSTLLTQLYVRVDICMYMLKTPDHIVSLREEAWTHETISTPPLFFLLKCL